MKTLKITIILFIATFIVSLVEVGAIGCTRYFAGVTIEGHSNVYTSGESTKDYESEQYFKSISAQDKITWTDRNLDVRIINANTSAKTSYIEIEPGETATYTAGGITIHGTYKVNLKTSNILSNDVYFNGTWYLDNQSSRN